MNSRDKESILDSRITNASLRIFLEKKRNFFRKRRKKWQTREISIHVSVIFVIGNRRGIGLRNYCLLLGSDDKRTLKMNQLTVQSTVNTENVAKRRRLGAILFISWCKTIQSSPYLPTECLLTKLAERLAKIKSRGAIADKREGKISPVRVEKTFFSRPDALVIAKKVKTKLLKTLKRLCLENKYLRSLLEQVALHGKFQRNCKSEVSSSL